jgi:ABC-2 type transport system permease protein
VYKRIWAVLRKEFIHIIRDRQTLILILTIPLIQLMLFGYAVDINVDHIATVVADQSLDTASRAYVETIENSTFFDIVGYLEDEDAVIDAIDAGSAQAGIVIPANFISLVEQKQAQVLFLVDGSDLLTAQSGYGMAVTIAQAHSSEIMMRHIERSGLSAFSRMPLEGRLRVLYNPDISQIWFAIPNIVAMILQQQSIMMTAAAVVREREAGTMEQILVTPIRPAELLIGKIIPNIFIALANVLTVVAVGRYVFHVPFQGEFLLFFVLSLLFVFSGLGLGLLISTVTDNVDQTQQIALLIMFLGVMLSGFMFPRSTMPPALYLFGYLFPLTYFLPISRGVITKGVGFYPLLPHIAGLLIYSLITITIAAVAFRRGLE